MCSGWRRGLPGTAGDGGARTHPCCEHPPIQRRRPPEGLQRTLHPHVPWRVTITPSTVPAGYLPTLTGQGTPATDSSTGSATSTDLTTDGAEDLTLDFGFWAPAPAIRIVKKDAAGNDADTSATAVDLGTSPGATGLRYTITNTGTEDLKTIAVTDAVIANGTVTGLTCDFSALGGPASGTTWAGVFKVGDSFGCTADLAGVAFGSIHQDVATVTGVGNLSNTPVDDDNPYFAQVSQPPSVTIGDYVWYDADHDGVQDTGETGLPGVVLTVTRSDGQPAKFADGSPATTMSTDASGKYVFEKLEVLPAGVHYVSTISSDTVPEGYLPTLTGKGTPATDSSTGSATSTDLTTDGAEDRTLDFGFWLPTPAIDIEKVDAKGNDADFADQAANLGTAPGRTGLTYKVTNTGNERLFNVNVSDAMRNKNGKVTGFICTFPDGKKGTMWAGPFEVGASFGCTADLKGVQAGMDAHWDTGCVEAVGEFTKRRVEDKDDYYAVVDKKLPPTVWRPVIDIEKTDAYGKDADTAATATNVGTAPGSIGIIYTIKNTGNEPLKNIKVTDIVKSNGKIVGLSCVFPDKKTGVTWAGPLYPGQTFRCTATLVNVQAGVKHQNTGKVVGLGIKSGKPASDTDDYWTGADKDDPPTFGKPKLTIEKKDSRGRLADVWKNAAKLGDEPATANLVYVVANVGDEPVKGIKVTDRVVANGTVTGLSCTFPDGKKGTSWPGTLAVGARFTCTAKLSQVAAGTYHQNIGSVTAKGVTSGKGATASDSYWAIADGDGACERTRGCTY